MGRRRSAHRKLNHELTLMDTKAALITATIWLGVYPQPVWMR